MPSTSDSGPLVLYIKSRELSLKQDLVKRKSKYYLAGQEISEKKVLPPNFRKSDIKSEFFKYRFFKTKKKFLFSKNEFREHTKKFTTNSENGHTLK